MIVFTKDNPRARAKGILHSYSENGYLFCPIKNKRNATILIWQISGTPYDTFCNLCGTQVNFMKEDKIQQT